MDNRVKVLFFAKTGVGLIRDTFRFIFDETEETFDEFSDMVDDELEEWVCSDKFREIAVEEYGWKRL